MKKIVLSLCLLSLGMAIMAQENGAFVSVGVGTKVNDKAFRGADVSMQAGYNYKGLDVSAQLDFYSNRWGDNRVNSLAYYDYGDKAIFASLLDGKRNETFMTLRLNLGYDFLRFIRGNWRHHIRPYVGLGYSLRNETNNYCYQAKDMTTYSMGEQAQKGFELTLGIAYDFNITHHWAVGAFIEGNTLIREQPIMGLRARYSF